MISGLEGHLLEKSVLSLGGLAENVTVVFSEDLKMFPCLMLSTV